MKEWIEELCPEIAEWQAELIAEEAAKQVVAEREACAKMLELTDLGAFRDDPNTQRWFAEMLMGFANIIRARGEK